MRKCISLCVAVWAVVISVSGCGVKQEKQEEPQIKIEKNTKSGPETKTADYKEFFGGINGCAVIYETAKDTYTYYNEEQCRIQVSPWSTYKIASTLIGLHNQVITSEESKMGYNQNVYPMEAWNTDLTLKEAFQQSCVWYFRKVLDEVGQEKVQAKMQDLDYGNCDISQWGGNGVNPLPELNGYWLGSSLKISPFEQVQFLRNIFEGNTAYSKEEVEILKNIMRVETQENVTLYGKTGTGAGDEGWFVGFTEREGANVYFAVYLNDSSAENVNGAEAKRIAKAILFHVIGACPAKLGHTSWCKSSYGNCQ